MSTAGKAPRAGPGDSPAKAGPKAESTAAWLVTGEDPALVAEAVAQLVSAAVGQRDRGLVVEDFSGEELELGAVADACRTPPFLSDRRVVVVRDAGRFAADQLQPVIDYLKDPLPTTKLVVAGGGGQLPSRLTNAFRQSPAAVLMSTDVSAKEAHGWLTRRLSHAPVHLAPDAAGLVEAHLGEDLNRLSSLLGTLEAAYGTGARIGREELSPYLGQPGSVPPWDLTDAIDRGDSELALQLQRRLTEAGARHPLVVLAILQRHFNNILRVQSPAVASEAQAAEAMGLGPGRSTYPARKALDAARRLGATGSGDAILALAEAELAIKGKIEWEPIVVLEVLVARLCRLSRSSRSSPAPRGRPLAGAGGTGAEGGRPH